MADDFNNTERSLMRRSLTILKNVDPAARSEIDALIDRIEALSRTAYDDKRSTTTDLTSRGG